MPLIRLVCPDNASIVSLDSDDGISIPTTVEKDQLDNVYSYSTAYKINKPTTS